MHNSSDFIGERPYVLQMQKGLIEKVVRTDDSPQTGMTWYEAAEYCNWLSDQERISADQKCYEPNDGDKFAEGMRAKDNYLTLTGYRLPTEAEWEFACRAGTTTRFYFGENDSLLPKYAWYQIGGGSRGDCTWPVASLQPNDFGLFDMLGNVWQWCECPFRAYPGSDGAVATDVGTSEKVTNGQRPAPRRSV